MIRLFSLLHVAVWASTALFGSSCGSSIHEPRMTSKESYPGTLVDTRSIAPDFFWQQRVTAHYDDKRISFIAVVQLHQDKLPIVILSPTGHRAYTLVQEGRKISFVQSIDRRLPFSPKNILIDLHRIFFRGIEPRPSSDGVYSTQQEGELIVEVYKNKKLEERRYKRLDARPKGWIRVRYHGGMVDHTPPPRIDFVNGWYGYRLTIKTL
jgi:hypothetical protein